MRGSAAKCAREKNDVLSLVGGDLFEATMGPYWEPSIDKGLFVELGEGALVECVLKVLESQRILWQRGISVGRDIKERVSRVR